MNTAISHNEVSFDAPLLIIATTKVYCDRTCAFLTNIDISSAVAEHDREREREKYRA